VNRRDWVHMPHAAHFVCGHKCRFHLATYVGDYIVSTVGEYVPDSEIQIMFALMRENPLTERGDAREAEFLRKFGFEEIGLGRTYETMVFPAKRREDPAAQCCPWEIAEITEVEFAAYHDPVSATAGHQALCEKYANLDANSKLFT